MKNFDNMKPCSEYWKKYWQPWGHRYVSLGKIETYGEQYFFTSQYPHLLGFWRTKKYLEYDWLMYQQDFW